MIRQIQMPLFGIAAWFFLVSCSIAQFVDSRTHLTPPMGALRAHDMNAWDEIGCRLSTHDAQDGESIAYIYTLSRKRIEKTPKWEADQLDPKVSPGVALHFAKRKFEALQPWGNSNYTYELHLQQYWDRWLWAVIFRHAETQGVTEDKVFPIFVLMDGAVLKPEIKRQKLERFNLRPDDADQ